MPCRRSSGPPPCPGSAGRSGHLFSPRLSLLLGGLAGLPALFHKAAGDRQSAMTGTKKTLPQHQKPHCFIKSKLKAMRSSAEPEITDGCGVWLSSKRVSQLYHFSKITLHTWKKIGFPLTPGFKVSYREECRGKVPARWATTLR